MFPLSTSCHQDTMKQTLQLQFLLHLFINSSRAFSPLSIKRSRLSDDGSIGGFGLGKSPNIKCFAATSRSTASAIPIAEFEPEAAQGVMDSIILPMTEFDDRSRISRDAQGIIHGEAINANDERLQLTYGEFPLASFDALIDRGMPYMLQSELEQKSVEAAPISDDDYEAQLEYQIKNQPYGEFGKKRRHLVDLGSGCGRLALYAALTACRHGKGWNVHGIEISEMLHRIAVDALQTGMTNGFFYDLKGQPDDVEETYNGGMSTKVSLHLGDAKEQTDILKKASMVFCYSTVLPTDRFSEEIGALILSSEWSTFLAESCSNGCVVITTDRALNPEDGFHLVDRLDVENPALWGSTGFIHVLKK